MKNVVSREYMAVKRSYGFLDRQWVPGDITPETEKTPPQNKLTGVMFVPRETGMTLDDAREKVGQIARRVTKVGTKIGK